MPIKITTKRIHEPVDKEDGFRVFVERLWPNGLKKEAAQIELWFKIIAPSAELRKWFEYESTRWDEFKQRYYKELDIKKDLIMQLLLTGSHQKITLLYTNGNTEHNNATALKEYLERLIH